MGCPLPTSDAYYLAQLENTQKTLYRFAYIHPYACHPHSLFIGFNRRPIYRWTPTLFIVDSLILSILRGHVYCIVLATFINALTYFYYNVLVLVSTPAQECVQASHWRRVNEQQGCWPVDEYSRVE